MSHTKEREEKICLNCGAAVMGRYCQVCGQENTEPKETVWGLVSHFFNDITHFDGKFFSTVKYLITRPGFLSAEYIKGRRASYLHPIRMYVFTSAFFFIIFFSLFNPAELITRDDDDTEKLTALTEASASLKEKLPATTDNELKAAMLRSINDIDAQAMGLQKSIMAKAKKDSAKITSTKIILDSVGLQLKGNKYVPQDIIDSIQSGQKAIRSKNMGVTNILKYDYHSMIAYEAVQKELPPNRQDNWLTRQMIHKYILYKTKYKNDNREVSSLLLENMMHRLPQVLFVSLPVFALLLLMLYFRRDVYYVDHGIFTIHFYCAVFILLLVYFGINKIESVSGWGWLVWVKILLMLSIFVYLYKAMRNFYRQRRFKTVLKFILLNCFFFVVVVMMLLAFFILSVMQFS